MDNKTPFTHEDLMDSANLGSEPSAEYLQRVDMLDNVVRDCIYVSRGFSGIQSPTAKHFYASVLFTAMITRAVSLAHLVPFSPWAEKKIEHWDYSSATGIARTVLELRIAFYYLCVDACSEEEWYCRWNIFNLHDCMSRVRLFQALHDGEEQVAALLVTADEIKERLRENAYFQGLSEGQQRKFLNGQTAYLLSLEEIAEKAGVLKSNFRWMYVLFSSHVHALPMSFYRIGMGKEERGRGLPSPTEEMYTGLCISLVCSLMVATRDEMNTLFGDYREHAAEKIDREAEHAEAQAEVKDVPNSGMAIGDTIRLTETEMVSIDVVRVSEDDYEFVYKHKATGSVVLRRLDSEHGGAGLYDLDPFFWTVLLNSHPVTEGQLEGINKGRYGFKVDHINRTVHFKVDGAENLLPGSHTPAPAA